MSIHAAPIHMSVTQAPSTYVHSVSHVHVKISTSHQPKITLGLQACLVLRRASSSKQVATFQKPKAPEMI